MSVQEHLFCPPKFLGWCLHAHGTVVCTGALTTAMTVTTASTSVSIVVVPGQNTMVLSPPLTPKDRMRGVAGFTVLLQQQHHSQKPVVTKTYD